MKSRAEIIERTSSHLYIFFPRVLVDRVGFTQDSHVHLRN